MSKNDNYFGEEYVNKSETELKTKEVPKSESINIDSEKYGISKPIRKVIKARITND